MYFSQCRLNIIFSHLFITTQFVIYCDVLFTKYNYQNEIYEMVLIALR